MSRYIDAEVLCKENFMCDCLACEDCYKTQKQRIDCEYYSTYSLQDFCEWISETPTADVVAVTRCMDCMHTEIDKYAPAECQNRCKLSQLYHEPTFFCKCGEPRTDLLEWIHRGDDDEQGV